MICRFEKRGIRYGPIRTASAICRFVASASGGTRAPVTYPPAPTIWWQPAQWSAKSAPTDSDVPAAGPRAGSAARAPSDAT